MNKGERIRLQLKRQLQFLLNSCQLFKAGCEEVRIATSLRVLLCDKEKDSKNQGSILKHLNAKETRIWSTCGGELQEDVSRVIFCDNYGPGVGIIQPWSHCLEQNPIQLKVSDWLNQTD
jgi:hypothetical protein